MNDHNRMKRFIMVNDPLILISMVLICMARNLYHSKEVTIVAQARICVYWQLSST